MTPKQMNSKSSKKVVLGVTGSIAAYKACEIASLLVKRGINVIPVLSESAQKLVGPATFEGLTGNTAITRMFEGETSSDIEHINVAQSADLFIVAPATANFIAKHAVGIADDWLTTALLATRAPVLVAPAMNTMMLQHSATEENISILRLRGCHVLGTASGTLACKTVGPGKMLDPKIIVEEAMLLMGSQPDLAGKTILITSGANHEPIDPVRYIGNRSSGKMGHAIATEALRRGGDVTVVAGPSDVPPPVGAQIIDVITASEMYDEVMLRAPKSDIVIGVAAVADYCVANPMAKKQKRSGVGLTLKLAENPDILAEVGNAKTNGQIVVGFAAETDDLESNAKVKLEKKGLDLIVANKVGTDRKSVV